MTWDPFGTIEETLWIGGGLWAGKSTVSHILAMRLRLTAYHCDYPNAHAHIDRRVAARVAAGKRVEPLDAEHLFVTRTPADMAADVLAGFKEQFEWTLDDLRALVSGGPIIAEGWALRPELVAPVMASPQQMIVLIPTAAWREHQIRTLPRAGKVGHTVSDPERAQRNRIERDAIVTTDAVEQARRLGIRVMDVDGTVDAHGIADEVQAHWAPFLDPQNVATQRDARDVTDTATPQDATVRRDAPGNATARPNDISAPRDPAA